MTLTEPKAVNVGGWELSWPKGEGAVRYGFVDVIPLDDLKEHVYGETCPCKPVDEEGAWIHNAFDGREKYETGGSPN
jgi:hypothetical protein